MNLQGRKHLSWGQCFRNEKHLLWFCLWNIQLGADSIIIGPLKALLERRSNSIPVCTTRERNIPNGIIHILWAIFATHIICGAHVSTGEFLQAPSSGATAFSGSCNFAARRGHLLNIKIICHVDNMSHCGYILKYSQSSYRLSVSGHSGDMCTA